MARPPGCCGPFLADLDRDAVKRVDDNKPRLVCAIIACKNWNPTRERRLVEKRPDCTSLVCVNRPGFLNKIAAQQGEIRATACQAFDKFQNNAVHDPPAMANSIRQTSLRFKDHCFFGRASEPEDENASGSLLGQLGPSATQARQFVQAAMDRISHGLHDARDSMERPGEH